MRSTARAAADRAEEPRIRVRHHTNGFSIQLLDRNPETRYQAPRRGLWEKFIDRLRIGWRGPGSVYKFGR